MQIADIELYRATSPDEFREKLEAQVADLPLISGVLDKGRVRSFRGWGLFHLSQSLWQ